MEYSELLINRRSIRNYKSKPVSMTLLTDLIKESVLAPNAGNIQPWGFVVINNKELLRDISGDCRKNILARIKNNPDDFAARYKQMLSNESFNIFYDAPSAVFVLGDRKVKNYKIDAALVASYLMMSAASKGLGTCWINFALAVEDPELLAKLNLIDGYEIVAPLAIGYPAGIPALTNRKKPLIRIVE